ncbi:MAG: hypothetical protein OEZ22_06980 [Spirochaetia bacterium]|nr:hypothetical protein [Spirochaetia bacterium]
MKKTYLFIVIISIIVNYLNCISFGISIPDEAGQYKSFESVPEILEEWKAYENSEEEVLVKKQSSVFTNSKNNNEIKVTWGKFSKPVYAIGAFLELRKKEKNNILSLNLARARWSFFTKAGTEAAFWQGKITVFAQSKNKLERDEWQSFLEALSSELPEGTPRPMPFTLLLREESNIKEVYFAFDLSAPNTKGLTEFFYAPWKSTKGEVVFGFRIFDNDEIFAVNYFNSLVTESQLHSAGILTEWDFSGKSFPVIIREGETKEYFCIQGITIYFIAGNIDEKTAREEMNKIFESWIF